MKIGNIEHKFVTEAKLAAMHEMVSGMLSGDVRQANRLKEHLTTGDDSIFALAALANNQVLEMYEDPARERKWTEIATTRTVDDFETPKFYSIESVTAGNTRPAKNGRNENPADVLPVVPEGSPYPRFTFKGEMLAPGKGLHKRGGVFSLTWEKLISDPENLIAQIPGLLLESFAEAEEFEVFDALLEAGKVSGTAMKGGTTLDGATVPANAPISRDAIAVAIQELRTRTIDGRPVRLDGQFKLVVPIGAKEQVEWMLNTLSLTEIKDGDKTFAVSPAYDTTAQKIASVVESEYVTGTEWYLIPVPGSTLRPGIELLKLRGHETPDIRFQNVNGQYAGGGQVGPFEGSFETDDAALRGRLPLRGVCWTPAMVLKSTGTGA